MKDWTAIKSDYIRTGGSLRSLAKRYGLSFHSVAKACRREDWPLLRRVHADGDKTAMAMATTGPEAATVATETQSALSLPERSQALKERVVSQLETDVCQVEQTPPQSLKDSQERQNVLSTVTRTAESVLDWGSKAPPMAVRIAVMSSVSIGPAPLALPLATTAEDEVLIQTDTPTGEQPYE